MQIFYISLHQISFFLLRKNIFNLVHFLLPTFVHHSETYSLSVTTQNIPYYYIFAKKYSQTKMYFRNFLNFNVYLSMKYQQSTMYLQIAMVLHPFIQ